ncbi:MULTISPECIES: hypothetical protein [unclassified Streptomyces]|uniref:hypothetical protein n=1 Tax=unclassified Streptomyces TaxID=2593676 RepID=UPI000C26FC43|nr:hypothetical protein [Streptomyces sp. CB01635]
MREEGFHRALGASRASAGHGSPRTRKGAASFTVTADHVGAGTTTTAARAGAPRVAVPEIVDQPHRPPPYWLNGARRRST